MHGCAEGWYQHWMAAIWEAEEGEQIQFSNVRWTVSNWDRVYCGWNWKKKKEGTCNMSLMQSKIYITYNLFVLFLLWMREAVTSERPNVIRSSVAAAQRLWWVCTLMFQCITLLTKKESGEGDGGWESISLFCILFWHFCSYLSKFTNCTVSFYN